MPQLKGVIKTPTGEPLGGATITLTSLHNRAGILKSVFSHVTTQNGEYDFPVLPGVYSVRLTQSTQRLSEIGVIRVYEDSADGSLNDFLGATDIDLRPEALKKFEELAQQAQQSAEKAGEHADAAEQARQDTETLAGEIRQDAEEIAGNVQKAEELASETNQNAARAEQAVKDADKIVQKAVDKLDEAATLTGEVKASAEAAAKSEQNAKSHADNAAGSAQQTAQDVTATETARDDAERFAENARQDAVATAEDRKATAEDVKSTGANAAAAGQSAQDAAGYARAAEQAKTDIDITLAGTLKTVNHLSEIAAAGTEAQQESRDNLGLKCAATMEPQNDTHDRTPGRLAIPGMFGFGKIFSSSDRTEFKSGTDFLRWVKTAKPGRYAVFADTNVVVPGIQINGVIEIIWPQPKTSPNDENAYKIIIYYGVNGHIYYNRCAVSSDGGYLVGWENLKVDEASLRALIETRAPLKSPALTGTPSTPTPPDDAAGNEIANAEFVRKLLAALVGSSPEALDTLNELAAALGNDPNFATTITNALAGKQPLNDVLTAVSQITPEENTLPYFSAEGRILLAQLSEKARALLALDTPEAMRTELELKAAATMESQSDIRDRTPGRLALSGMYGFGQAFTSTDALAFDGQADFAEWLKEATPGRYAVSIADSSTLLVGTTKFNGIIDVMWSPFDNDESDTTRKFKTLLCFNQYYEGEHSIHRLTYRWSGNNWNATVSPIIYDGDSLALFLSETAGNGPSSYYKYPAVGSLILAVYQGTAAGDKEIKIGLGDVVAGSRLGPVAIDCAINNSGTYVSTPSVKAGGAGAFSFPGRYQALSGYRGTYGDRGFICLFVRIE
ncbi:phage tail fiber protein [Escherichia coli]|uniref:prophage tail fiber N-terminal domain-containing protein n=1 Tax=Escherichia coli TaxID=562 RepID=UPI0010CB21BF|nr:prophage tail fiber N-terminal domain-containing protein [Escherichia coli]GDA81478.1 phage tail fiber protein [Escherichia coli]